MTVFLKKVSNSYSMLKGAEAIWLTTCAQNFYDDRFFRSDELGVPSL